MKRIKRLLACTLIAALCIGFGAMSASAENLGVNYSYEASFGNSYASMQYEVGSVNTHGARARTGVDLQVYYSGLATTQIMTNAGYGQQTVNSIAGGYSGYLYTPWAYGTGAGSQYYVGKRIDHYASYSSLMDSSDKDTFYRTYQ